MSRRSAPLPGGQKELSEADELYLFFLLMAAGGYIESVCRPHRTLLLLLELDTSDAWTLFKLMDTSGNGDLDASEFVEGCMRLKGPARSIDVAIMMQEHKRVRKKVMSIAQEVTDIHTAILLSQRHIRGKQPASIEHVARSTWPVSL